MNQEQWQKVKALFDAGLELSPEACAEYWRLQCGNDRAVLAELERLLDGHRRAEQIEFMEPPAPSRTTEVSQSRPGETIGKRIGEYTLVRLLGRGGMGEVYLAQKPLLARPVVVKLVKADASLAIRKQFLNEIRVHEQLEHENIVRLRDAGLHEGVPYLVLDYFEGQSLREFLSLPESDNQQRALPFDQVADITNQIAAGLGYAHRQHRITHRDIKPENILVDSQNGFKVKVIDFGIAILPELFGTQLRSGSSRRPTIGAAGTPVYMSPEQIQNGLAGQKLREIDQRSDIYSLGLVIYEMLTGQMAFPQATHRFHGQFEWPSARRKGLPAGVDEVLKTALHEDPDGRYQSAEDLARALELALTRRKRPVPWLKIATIGAGVLGVVLCCWLIIKTLPWRDRIQQAPSSALPSATVSPTPTRVEDRLNISLYRQQPNGRAGLVSSETAFANSSPRDQSGGLRLGIDAARSGFIYILEQNDSGEVRILYPDWRNPSGFRPIPTGEKVYLPKEDGWFRFTGASGTDVVYILFTTERGDPLFA
ncbi:MAG TPA: protein kinase, partial [Blastocatellia bacterium]|nr:protein kinase [Blastocatellia bacterium]